MTLFKTAQRSIVVSRETVVGCAFVAREVGPLPQLRLEDLGEPGRQSHLGLWGSRKRV